MHPEPPRLLDRMRLGLRAKHSSWRTEQAYVHWGIENRLHWVRDVTLGEDRCRVRTGRAPQDLAAFRNAALSLLRLAGFQEIAPTLRDFAYQPRKLLRFLGIMKN